MDQSFSLTKYSLYFLIYFLDLNKVYVHLKGMLPIFCLLNIYIYINLPLWVWVNKFVLKTIIALNVTSLLSLLEPEIKRVVCFIYNSPEDLDLHQFLQGIDIGELPDGDEFEAFMSNWLRLPVSGFAALVRTLALYFFGEVPLTLPSFSRDVLPLCHLELKFHEPVPLLSHLFTLYLINT